MRFALIALGLTLLAGCAQPIAVASYDDNVGLMKFITPVNGAAYSQSDLYYYTANAGNWAGPSGSFKH